MVNGPQEPIGGEIPQDLVEPLSEIPPDSDPFPALMMKEIGERIRSVVTESGYDVPLTSPQKSNRVSGFDRLAFERLLRTLHVRELGREDIETVANLYKNQEMDSDIFFSLRHGIYDSAELQARSGGFIDQWQSPSNVVDVLHTINPRYVPSGEEFRGFLERTHNRPGEFRSWGLFDPAEKVLHAVACSFLPPKSKGKLRAYKKELKTFFRGEHSQANFRPHHHFQEKQMIDRAGTTAEFYLISSDAPGGGTYILHHMFEELQAERPDITDWYLLRFGSLRMVHPIDDQRIACDSENSVSGDFFRKRGFRNCGMCKFKGQIAGREVHAGKTEGESGQNEVVVVEPEWIVMSGTSQEIYAATRTGWEHVQAQASSEGLDEGAIVVGGGGK